MKSIEASIVIRRPLEEVFAFFRDFTNLPKFMGDVMAVKPIDTTTSRWTIQGPLRIRRKWTIRVTEERANELVCYELGGLRALKTRWEVRFRRGASSGETEVREVMTGPLGRFSRATTALLGKHPAEEVSSNLHRLEQLMETGSVSDTRYAVPGKFAVQHH
jgi:uncharacterized membrane protein